jgi:plasmid maintenance system antidote protein VapI
MKKTIETPKKVSITALAASLAPSEGANVFLSKYFENIGLNNARVSERIDVAPSTIKRLLDGGNLSVEMASKLFNAFKLKPEFLFKIEAKQQTFLAQQLIG